MVGIHAEPLSMLCGFVFVVGRENNERTAGACLRLNERPFEESERDGGVVCSFDGGE